MNPIYETLYTCYAEKILSEAGLYDEESIKTMLSAFPLDQATRYGLLNQLFLCYIQWTMDAFSIGLQLGLRLMSGPGLKQ